MRYTHFALILSLFVSSMAFADANNDVDAACAEDICLNSKGEQVSCVSEEDETTDGTYCFHWNWRWNHSRGWHHHGHRHRW